MIPSPLASLPILALVLLLDACASRPINPPITQVEPSTGYRHPMSHALNYPSPKAN